VQVVLAAEGVPVGDYARQSLENAGIEDAVLSNVVSDEEDDSSVVAKIIAGEADAAIVYTSDVTSGVAPQVGSVAIPDDVNVVATYPIAVMSTTLHADLARAFVEYVSGSEGEATLADLGFLPAPAS